MIRRYLADFVFAALFLAWLSIVCCGFLDLYLLGYFP